MRKRLGKTLLGLAVALVVALLGTYLLPLTYAGALGHTAIRLTLAYAGAEAGLAPDGTPLDINRLKSDDVLTRALAGAGVIELDAAGLRARLRIVPVLTADPTRGIIYGEAKGPGNTQEVVPAQVRPAAYTIVLSGGLGGKEQALLGEVARAFIAQLGSDYLAAPEVAALAQRDLAQADYREAVALLAGRAQALEQRAGRYEANAGNAGELSQLCGEAEVMRAVTLQQMLDEIDLYGLAKDPGARLAYDRALLARQRAELAALNDNMAFVYGLLGTQAELPALPEVPEPPVQAEEPEEDADAQDGAAADDEPEAAAPPAGEGTAAGVPAAETAVATGGNAWLLEQALEGADAMAQLRDEIQRTENRLEALSDGAGTRSRAENLAAAIETAAGRLYELETRLEGLARASFSADYEANMPVSRAVFVRYTFGHPVVNFLVLAAVWLAISWAAARLKRSGRRHARPARGKKAQSGEEEAP